MVYQHYINLYTNTFKVCKKINSYYLTIQNAFKVENIL